MSYILQALKKSEREREQAASNNIQSLEQASVVPLMNITGKDSFTEQQSNRYKILSLVAAGLMVVIVIVFIAKSGLLFSSTQVPTSVTPMLSPALALVDKGLAESELNTPPARGDHLIVIEPAVTKLVADMPIAVEQAPEDVISLIPNIEISSHIFSSQPERRSIVVNGERLLEGDFIAPEVQVREVTHQGMVIDVNGWLLLVGRSRGWDR